MGILDDAIREHLELKRQHGASEEDVKRQEEEVLGQRPAPGAEPPSDSDELSELESLEPDAGPADSEAESFGPTGPPAGEPDDLDSALEAPEPPPAAAGPEELDPDEVLPEEALELEPSALPEPPPPNGAGAADSDSDWRGAEGASGSGRDEDLLVDTPEFLEEAPDQDRLWFEQKPPKDFDFDD
jgi:hypothetical protein